MEHDAVKRSKLKCRVRPGGPNGDCLRCGSKCCRYLALPIDKPETPGDFNDLHWFLLHDGISVFVEDGDWYMQIDNPCRALSPSGLCTVYADRPRICRSYRLSECEFTQPDSVYELILRTPEECADYAARYLREKRRKAARRRRTTAAPTQRRPPE
jgi:uncharacterized protein